MTLSVRRVLQLKGGVGIETTPPQTPVRAALARCGATGAGGLIVAAEDGALLGVFDAVAAAAAVANGDRRFDLIVADLMDSEPPRCGLGEDIGAVARRVRDAGVAIIPVVDAETLVGALSFGDIARAMLRDREMSDHALPDAA